MRGRGELNAVALAIAFLALFLLPLAVRLVPDHRWHGVLVARRRRRIGQHVERSIGLDQPVANDLSIPMHGAHAGGVIDRGEKRLRGPVRPVFPEDLRILPLLFLGLSPLFIGLWYEVIGQIRRDADSGYSMGALL